jgi:hypothetical protein
LAEGASEKTLFDIKNVWSFNIKGNKGYRPKGVFGDHFYTAKNPPSGPVLSIYSKEKIVGLNEERRKDEKSSNANYPAYDQLKAEDYEANPGLYALIKDEAGNIISKTTVRNKKGFQRVEAGMSTLIYGADEETRSSGPSPIEGKFSAQLYKEKDGKVVAISEEVTFMVEHLKFSEEMPTEDYYTFYSSVSKTMVDLRGLQKIIGEKLEEIDNKKEMARAAGKIIDIADWDKKRKALLDLQYVLNGDETRRKRFQYYHPGTAQKLQRVYRNMSNGNQITQTHRDSYEEVKQEIKDIKLALLGM